jgi:hypothetical protein
MAVREMPVPFKTVLSGDREAVAKLSFVVRTVFARIYLHCVRLANAAHFCQSVGRVARRQIPIEPILVDETPTIVWLYIPLSRIIIM